MKPVRANLAVLLLIASFALPARADFKYTETSQVTGGALVSMMKVAGIFARGDAKKQEQQAMQPTSTTHYVKGSKLRTDNADGTSQVIDLANKRVISIDNTNKTYGVATFDQIHDAMVQAMQNAQQRQQAQLAQHPELQNAQLNITPAIKVTPGTGNRVILGQSTNETKVEMDMTMQATGAAANARPSGQPNSATMTTNMDTFVAPSVTGYQEFAQFYRHMAEDVSWMQLPSSIHVTDPRVSQSMAELQQNSEALKGFPMLSYVSMGMASVGQTNGSQTAVQNQSPAPPSQTNSSSSNSSRDDFPTSPSAVVTKGLGSLFGKKKQSQEQSSQSGKSTDQGNASGDTAAPPQNSSSNPNDLIEVTTQVTQFSDSSLDGSLFDTPAGYKQIQVDPAVIMAGRTQAQQPSQSK
jgi:hypothetical protein